MTIEKTVVSQWVCSPLAEAVQDAQGAHVSYLHADTEQKRPCQTVAEYAVKHTVITVKHTMMTVMMQCSECSERNEAFGDCPQCVMHSA